jgi:hypothetical protein
LSYIILVTGSRDWGDYATILEALAAFEGQPDVVVRHGACSYLDAKTGEELSADMLADRAAKYLGFETDPMAADWKKYRNAAGPIRNMEMIKKQPKPNRCLAFGRLCKGKNGKPCQLVQGKHVSHGTRHCSIAAEKAEIEVVRYKIA